MSDFSIRVMLVLQNELGIIPSSPVLFLKSFRRIGINSSLNVIVFSREVKLTLNFSVLGSFWLAIQFLYLLLVCSSFLFLHEYLDRLCVLRNLFISSQLSKLLAYNCSLHIFFSDFSYLSILPVLLGSLAKIFSILLNFSTNQLSFIDFFLFSIWFISAIIFISFFLLALSLVCSFSGFLSWKLVCWFKVFLLF